MAVPGTNFVVKQPTQKCYNIPKPLYKLFAQVVGDVDKSLPMLCEQLGTRLTKDKMKPDIRDLLGFVAAGSWGISMG